MRIMWLRPVTAAENVARSVFIVLTLEAHKQRVELACSFLGVWLSVLFFVPSVATHSSPSLSGAAFWAARGKGQGKKRNIRSWWMSALSDTLPLE